MKGVCKRGNEECKESERDREGPVICTEPRQDKRAQLKSDLISTIQGSFQRPVFSFSSFSTLRLEADEMRFMPFSIRRYHVIMN